MKPEKKDKPSSDNEWRPALERRRFYYSAHIPERRKHQERQFSALNALPIPMYTNVNGTQLH